MFAEHREGYILTAFDDQLVMDVTAEAVGEGLHGVHQKVTGDCLDGILHELRTVGLQPLPLLRAADVFVGDEFSVDIALSAPVLPP